MKKQFIDSLPIGIRVQATATVTLLLFIAVFKWMDLRLNFNNDIELVPANEQLVLDLIDITYQDVVPASPPKPSVPISISSDPFVEDFSFDLELDYQLVPVTIPSSGIPGIAVDNSNGGIVRNPQRSPRVSRIVEPVSPNVSISAEIMAELTISPNGRVEDVEIMEIRVYNDRSRQYELTATIDPGFIDAVLEAAYQWQFRPAEHNGKAVRSVSRHVFTFGRGIN